jgi:hypothetical protein
MLNTFYEFQHLAYALSLLSEQIEKLDSFDNNSKIIELFKTIIEDLIKWKNEVFLEQSALDIHSIDDLLYINVAQIDILLDSSEKQREMIFL